MYLSVFLRFVANFPKGSLDLNEKMAVLGPILAIFDGFKPIFNSKTAHFLDFLSISHEINCNFELIL